MRDEEAEAWWKENKGKIPRLIQPGEVIVKDRPPKPPIVKPLQPHDCAVTKAISLTEQQANEAIAYFKERRVAFLKKPCTTCDGWHVIRSNRTKGKP
jgi:hypothetical protein